MSSKASRRQRHGIHLLTSSFAVGVSQTYRGTHSHCLALGMHPQSPCPLKVTPMLFITRAAIRRRSESGATRKCSYRPLRRSITLTVLMLVQA